MVINNNFLVNFENYLNTNYKLINESIKYGIPNYNKL